MIESTIVCATPNQTCSTSPPCGHAGADVRSSAYDENNAPKSITSDAMNSQMPSVTFVTPVSGRRSIVYGIMAAAAE